MIVLVRIIALLMVIALMRSALHGKQKSFDDGRERDDKRFDSVGHGLFG